MNQGITITVNANTAEAAAKLQSFFKNALTGVDRLTGASGVLQGFADKLVGALAVGGMIAFAKETINAAESLGKLSQQTGLAISTLSGIKKEAHALGIPFEELNSSLGIFSDRIFSAISMGGQAAQTFRDLKISFATSNGALRDTNEILRDVFEAFKDMPNGPEKTAAAMNLFGRAGRELIPILNRGAEEMDRIKAQGGGLDEGDVQRATEFNREWREIEATFKSAAKTLIYEMLPALKKLADEIKGSISGQSLKGLLLTAAMEFIKLLAEGLVKAAEIFATTLLRLIVMAGEALANVVVKALNSVVDFINAHPAVAALFGVSGGTITTRLKVDSAGVKDFVADWIKGIEAGGSVLREKIGAFFDQGIAASKALFPKNKSAGSASPSAEGKSSAVVSDEADKLILEIDKAYAEATQGKLALLNVEEAALKQKVDLEIMDHAEAEKEKTKISAIYIQKRGEIQEQAWLELYKKQRDLQEAASQTALAEVEAKRKGVESDPYLTRREKLRQLLPLYQDENALLLQNIELQKSRLNNPVQSDEVKIEAQKQLVQLQQQQVDLLRQQQELQDSQDFAGTMKRGLTQLYDTWSAIGPNLANGIIGGVADAVHGVGDAIMGVIDGTRTWGQVFSQIGRQIIANIIQIVVQWIASMTIIAALKKLFGVQDTQQAATSAAAWAPAALAASIASYGSAAAIGGAAFTAAMIAGTALASGLSVGGGIAGRAAGGPVNPNTPYIVGERGPEFFVPDSAGRIIPAYQKAQIMRASGGNPVASSPVGNVTVKTIVVADFKQVALEVMKSEPGTKHIIQTVDGRRLDLGMDT